MMSFWNLTFLAPVALLGLLALAIPIYLHMRHKPRAEAYRFPAIDFLLRAQKKRKRRFQVEQWVLMLMRILVISVLAFLFAKPFIDEQLNSRTMNGNQPLLLVLDDSASMLAGPENNRFFFQAVSTARTLTGSRGYGSPTRLLLASEPLAHAELKTAGEIRQALDEVKPTTYGATLDHAYKEALNIIDSEDWQQATIQILTDGSASAWQSLPSAKPEKVDVIYTSMREGLQNFSNRAVLGVSQSPGDTNSVEVELFNSDAQAAEINLRLEADGLSRLPHRLRLDGYAKVAHRFALVSPVPATLRVRIPDDSFDLDNQVVYAPMANKRVRILLVDGDSHPQALKSESFFMKNALGAEESDKYGYVLDTVTPAGFSAEKAEAADVLCLLNVDVPANLLLEQALSAGKGVFVAMGERMDFDRWNQFFGQYDLEVWEPKTLEAPEPIRIGPVDHPFFYPVEEIEWRGYLQGVGIEKFRIVSVGRSNFDIPLSRYDGSPLLLAKDLSPGRLMIWTSTVDLDWTNFPLEFGFVPFARQVISYLSRSESSESFQSYTVEELRDAGIEDQLNLKYVSEVYNELGLTGPKPGVYTRQIRGIPQIVQVRLDPGELDFRSFDSGERERAEAGALAELGFRSFLRWDLAPSIQWFLFALILFETLVAARLTLNWGAR